ncbi:transglycosylase domain-containing protein [Streptomyces sp. NPDC092296]|uniref:transglycosylase domain-containing protein n=1 Tax=Streptomyces sp. NPDC092296 TaxID=3366012 RepID=UPI0038028F8D
MSEQSRSAQRRARRRAARAARRARRTGWRRLLPSWRMTLGALLLFVLACTGAFVFLYLTVPVPDANAQAVAQSNVYYYSDGKTELGRTGEVNRESVPLAQIPLDTQRAVVSAEDRSFYKNKGVDVKGSLRAALNTITGKGTQGGSTITQQYVKNYYLTQEQTVSRKVKEIFISLKVDQTESKEQILDGYLNTSYFGRNAYGIQAAARAYYGKDAAALTTEQGAYLAALLQAPSQYDVAVATPANRRAAVARWNYVLNGMVTEGWLTPARRAGMTFPEPIAPKATPGVGGQAGYLVEIARDSLLESKAIDEATLQAGGWKITTTFDKKKQNAFVSAVKSELTDQLDPKARPDTDTDVRVGGASIEPTTGKIVAAYGGADYATQPYNDATRRDNPIGSTFKAFDLAAGLQGDHTTQNGKPITTQTVYDGTSRRPVVGGGPHWAPPNEDDKDYGPITLRYAMMKSVNSVYAQEAVDAGLQNVRDTAVALGLPANTKDMDPANSSMALGTATPSALDLAGAYATLANHGGRITPWAVQRLERTNGTVVALPTHHTTQAISQGTADAVTSVLQDVVSPSGTGYAALGLGRPAAGKTGTTDKNVSAWFAGYTPQLVTTVGIFRENPRTHAKESLNGTAGLARINGGAFPTEIWTAYMKGALQGTKTVDFDLAPSTGNSGPPVVATSPSASASPSTSAGPSPSGSPSAQQPSPAQSPETPSPSGEDTGMPSGIPSAGDILGDIAGGTGGTGSTGGTGGTGSTGSAAPSGPSEGDTGAGGGGRTTGGNSGHPAGPDATLPDR